MHAGSKHQGSTLIMHLLALQHPFWSFYFLLFLSSCHLQHLGENMASIGTACETKRKCEYPNGPASKLLRQNSGFDNDGNYDDDDADELLEDCPLEDPELTEEEERSLDYIPEYSPDRDNDHERLCMAGSTCTTSSDSDSLAKFRDSDSDNTCKPGIARSSTCTSSGSGTTDGGTGDHVNLRTGKKFISTVNYLSGFPASSWNDYPQLVYSVFKVKRYIVHPNYILCMTTNPFVARQQKYQPTVNTILKRNYGNPSFVKWNDVKDELLKVQGVYRGCEHIPNMLRDIKEAAANIRVNFKQSITGCLRRNDTSLSAYKDLLCFLQDFSGEFVNDLKHHKLREEMFAEYLNRLISFFTTTLMIPGTRPISSLSLNLAPADQSECRTMTVKPDLQLSSYNNIVLVGEAKNFGVVPKAYENYKGHRVEDPAEKKQLPDATGNEPKDTQNTEKLIYYRKLNRKECFKIDCYLPQLIAEMLAAMDTNKKRGRYVKLCQENEWVQLGLTLEGFKLRFVRLVLRHADPDTEPDLSTISSSLVRCDVFLTQELNLFKDLHLKMFFQILYAILKAHV